jgi:hypothetical protein
MPDSLAESADLFNESDDKSGSIQSDHGGDSDDRFHHKEKGPVSDP